MIISTLPEGLAELVLSDSTVTIAHIQRVGALSDNVDTMKLAKQWLQLCLENHPDCKSNQMEPTSLLPKRLIQVPIDEAAAALLREEDLDDKIQYAPLSYCWGPGATQQMLTSRNLDSYTNP